MLPDGSYISSQLAESVKHDQLRLLALTIVLCVFIRNIFTIVRWIRGAGWKVRRTRFERSGSTCLLI